MMKQLTKKTKRFLLVCRISIFDTQSIKRIPRILIIHTQPHPLCHNLLLPLHHRTSTMFRESIIHLHLHRINITKERGSILLWLNVYIGISKPRRPTLLGHFAVHDYRGHAIARLEIQSSTVSITMGHVSIRLFVIFTPSKVLNGHEILLPVLLNVKWQHVIDILVHTPRKPCDQIPIRLLIPMHLDPRLLGLSRIAQFAPPAPIGNGGIVQNRLGRILHRLALVGCQEILNRVNPRGGTIDHDFHLASEPSFGAFGLRGV
mmetsp:Transcript_17757/g.38356  ORF Transcript_17757/g.38356 Transcript_17757/m.38356 type:complete len:261 (+) Transcript_17757:230-1012(+)